MRFNELRESGAIKIETPRRKIIIRKSETQAIQPNYFSQTKASKAAQAWAEPVAETEQKTIRKFVKEIIMKPRNSHVTPPSIEDNITTASNSINRAFGNSVRGVHQRFFSDVNQRSNINESTESEENDCPFDFAVEDNINEED